MTVMSMQVILHTAHKCDTIHEKVPSLSSGVTKISCWYLVIFRRYQDL